MYIYLRTFLCESQNFAFHDIGNPIHDVIHLNILFLSSSAFVTINMQKVELLTASRSHESHKAVTVLKYP